MITSRECLCFSCDMAGHFPDSPRIREQSVVLRELWRPYLLPKADASLDGCWTKGKDISITRRQTDFSLFRKEGLEEFGGGGGRPNGPPEETCSPAGRQPASFRPGASHPAVPGSVVGQGSFLTPFEITSGHDVIVTMRFLESGEGPCISWGLMERTHGE